MVAKVDEQKAAMVANAMYPAGQADGLADVLFAKFSASVGAILVHGVGIASGLARQGFQVRGNSAWDGVPCQGGAREGHSSGTMAWHIGFAFGPNNWEKRHVKVPYRRDERRGGRSVAVQPWNTSGSRRRH